MGSRAISYHIPAYRERSTEEAVGTSPAVWTVEQAASIRQNATDVINADIQSLGFEERDIL